MDKEFNPQTEADIFDFSFVYTTARIAVYDDLKSAPRIIEIEPAPTGEYIEALSQAIYEAAQKLGGTIPYTIIREVAENFIHARFLEVVISIFDQGNTIRFADQGPGIQEKERSQMPGFSSAIEPMKSYIRGVGSGLPLVREYLKASSGSLIIEDNVGAGTVVTLSTKPQLNTSLESNQIQKQEIPPVQQHDTEEHKHLSELQKAKERALTLKPRQQKIMQLIADYGSLGVTDIVKATSMPQSTVYNELAQFEDEGLVKKDEDKKRSLTEFGLEVVEFFN